MNPEDEFRRLQDPARWNELTPTPRRVQPPTGSRFRGAIVLAAVVVIVVAGTIGALRLGDLRANRAAAPTPVPTSSPTTSPTPDPSASALDAAATYTVHGDQQVHSTTVHGVGASGSTSLDAVLTELRSIFGSAVRGNGGGPKARNAFLLLKRAPTAAELTAVRALPYTVRLHWSDWPSDKTLEKLDTAASAAIKPYLSDAYGDRDGETYAISTTYWPALGSTLTPEQVAKVAAKAARTAGNGTLPVDITVTDASRTAKAIAEATIKTRTTADDGTTLLVGNHLPFIDFGMGGAGVIATSPSRCVTMGGKVVIAPPGSSISADGRSIELKGIGMVALGTNLTSRMPMASSTPPANATGLSTQSLTAARAAIFLPHGAGACAASSYVLIVGR